MNNQNQPASPDVSQGGQPTTPEQPTSSQQPQPKPKLPTWLSVLGIVIAAVIVLGLVAWGGYELFKPTPPEESVVEDEFKDWETLIGSFGYTIKYPSNLNTYLGWVGPGAEEQEKIDTISDTSLPCIHDICGDIVVDIFREKNEKKESLTDIKERELELSKGLYEIYSVENITINNSPALRIKAYGMILVYLIKDDYIYMLRGSGKQFERTKENYESKYVETIIKIQNTFKFIEPEISTGWKTYQNEEYGWEVQYPEKYFLNDRSTPESVIFDTEGIATGLMIEIIERSFVERMDQLGSEEWQGKGTKGFNDIVWSILYREGTDLVPGTWYKSIKQYGIENKVIEITLNRSTEDLFNQILFTFKFTD